MDQTGAARSDRAYGAGLWTWADTAASGAASDPYPRHSDSLAEALTVRTMLDLARMDLGLVGLLPFVEREISNPTLEIRAEEDGKVIWRAPGRCPEPTCTCQGTGGLSASLRRLG